MDGDILDIKAFFIGVWKGDIVSDNIIQHLKQRTEASRGKKVKIRLSQHGIQIKKYAMFQGSLFFDSYRMEDIFFVTINQQSRSCLLIIVRDPDIKYSILAFRCLSDREAGQFVQTFKSLKRRGRGEHYEMTRKENGNWTLRGKSSSSTRHYLAPPKIVVNGAPNGHIKNYHNTEVQEVTTLPHSTALVKEEMFVRGRKQTNIGTQATNEIDIDQISEASDVSAFKDEIESLSHELREIKYLLEKSTGISAEEHYRRAKESSMNNNNNDVQKYSSHDAEDGVARIFISGESAASTQMVQTVSTSNGNAFNDDPDYRSYGVQTVPGHYSSRPRIKSSEVARVLKREFSSSSNSEEVAPRVIALPFAGETKTSNGQAGEIIEGHVSSRETVRIRAEPVLSARVASDRRSRSMRVSTDFMVKGVPSTIERPIEKTYARPTILKSGHLYETHRHHNVRRHRPQSVYIMNGAQPVRVHNPKMAYEATF